jgi:hypothetical protein
MESLRYVPSSGGVSRAPGGVGAADQRDQRQEFRRGAASGDDGVREPIQQKGMARKSNRG